MPLEKFNSSSHGEETSDTAANLSTACRNSANGVSLDKKILFEWYERLIAGEEKISGDFWSLCHSGTGCCQCIQGNSICSSPCRDRATDCQWKG